MGRGRAKAKQTKVARELKYGGPQTDFDRLQAELANSEVPVRSFAAEEVAEDAGDEDPYAKYYEDDEEEESER
ncbi:MAG: DUF3073 domain-containing protein [Actinomycetes bacterium]